MCMVFLFHWLGHKPTIEAICSVNTNTCILSLHLLTSTDLADTAAPFSDTVKTLGGNLDRLHIAHLCNPCFHHIRAIHHISSALTKNLVQTIASSLVN